MAEDFDAEITRERLQELERKYSRLRLQTWVLSIPLAVTYLIVAGRCTMHQCTPGEWFVTFLVPAVLLLWVAFYAVQRRRATRD
jgi:uncharacterized membrane protein